VNREGEHHCPNCRQSVTKHRPWCGDVRATEQPKEGDFIDHPVFGKTELISVYSRAQAIDDGILIDCTRDPFDELNRNAGVTFDVAMTSAAFQRYVKVPEGFHGSQDIEGRYWDIIWMFRSATRRSKTNDHELLFDFVCLANGTDEANDEQTCGAGYELVQLKAIAGPGDRGEPCLTFMLPSED
jgi:hypothetical protein